MEIEMSVLVKNLVEGAYTIAGIEIGSGRWVRLVSNDRIHGMAIPPEDIQYEDHHEVEVLDQIRVKLADSRKSKGSLENCKYDASIYWQKLGETTLEEIVENRGLDKPDQIFYNTGKFVYEDEIGNDPDMLLVKVEEPYINVITFPDSNKKVQFSFVYQGINYKYLTIRDEKIKKEFLQLEEGDYPYNGEKIVVFALTKKYKYKETYKYYKYISKLF